MLYRDQTLGLSTQCGSSYNTRAATRLEKVRVILNYSRQSKLNYHQRRDFKDIFSLN